jgi:hypothetical protein
MYTDALLGLRALYELLLQLAAFLALSKQIEPLRLTYVQQSAIHLYS